MWWDNFLLISTIIYLFLLPLCVCHDKHLTWSNFFLLSNFDYFFIIDSFLNLLIGFYDKDGNYEPKIVVVIVKNFSYGTILELIYYLIPLFLGIQNISSLIYFVFKIPRYNRLTEMAHAVNTYLDYYGSDMNVI